MKTKSKIRFEGRQDDLLNLVAELTRLGVECSEVVSGRMFRSQFIAVVHPTNAKRVFGMAMRFNAEYTKA